MCRQRKNVINKSSSNQKGRGSINKRCRKQKFISKFKIKTVLGNKNDKVSCSDNSDLRSKREDKGPSQYTVFCIVNRTFFKSKGSLVASVARGFLDLYNKIARDRVKVKYLDHWEESGERLVIMNGMNHKHLEYLAEELYYAAIGTSLYYETWSRSKILLVLTVLGREEDIEYLFEGLSELR